MLMMSVLASELFVATSATQPDTLIQPVIHDRPRRREGGAIMATQWYCPPAVGYADSSSARLAAKLRLHIPAVTRPQSTESGPPEGSASDREEASAVHELRIAKASPNIDHFENCRSKDWA